MSTRDEMRRIRDEAMNDFEACWEEFHSPTEAAGVVAQRWGVGRTTVIGWLKEARRWPVANPLRIKRLEKENTQLRDQVRELRARIRLLESENSNEQG